MPPATPAKSAASPPPTARPAAPWLPIARTKSTRCWRNSMGRRMPRRNRRPLSRRPAADVLDLTEAMAAPTPSPGPAPSFRTIDGASDVVFSDAAKTRSRHPPARPRADFERRPSRRSTAPSIRWPIPCSGRTRARSRIWCRKCCGRCSSPGSTTICRAWSSASCAPRSSASRAAGRKNSWRSFRDAPKGADPESYPGRCHGFRVRSLCSAPE